MKPGLVALLLSVPAIPFAGAEISFVPAPTCALCHARMEAPKGASGTIGQFPLWSGSMMAHASRDPYWKAKVRHEVAITPAAGAVIEDKCLRCHAPSEQYGLRERGGMRLAGLTPGGGEGVTCTVCHQITPASLGTRTSFSGGFRIGTEDKIFGPHENPFTMPMLHHTGYTATQSKHILDAGLCGSCHTVITPTLAPDGKVVGEFIEQAPYLEWLASEYPGAGVTCQSCHVPVLESTRGEEAAQFIAHRPMGGPFPPTRPRSPFGLHFFAGANTAMLAALAGQSPDEAVILRRNETRARASLESALDLGVTAAATGATLEVSVEVNNRTGHKLPTAFPSRRIWLDVRILGPDGATLFESGAWDRGTGELHASAEQPHHAVISRPSQAMIYEATYLDPQGKKTMSLLRAATYGKDNRILPRGFDRARALPGGMNATQIGPAGTAGDTGFRPGSHRVRYAYDFGRGPRPARVRVEAWYQSIAPAHAAALAGVEQADIRHFLGIYPSARLPVLMAAGETVVSLSSPRR
jgi:hypothetical protein